MKYLALLFFSAAALAGDQTVQKTVITPDTITVLPWSLKLDAAWVGEGDYDKGGNGSVYESRLQVAFQRPISLGLFSGRGGQWVLRGGVDYERFTFDHSAGAPDFLPGSLQSTALLMGLEYRTPRGLGALLEARPGMYFEHHATGDSWNVPLRAAVVLPMGAASLWSSPPPTIRFAKIQSSPASAFGGRSPTSSRCTPSRPEPRLEYHATENLRYFLGGEIAGGSYRVDAGRDDHLNAAVVSYSDYRASAGVAWKINSAWSFDAGAGVSFYRKFDFHRAEVGVKTDDLAPFVKFSLRGEF